MAIEIVIAAAKAGFPVLFIIFDSLILSVKLI